MTRNIDLLLAILKEAENTKAGQVLMKWPAPKEFVEQGIGNREIAEHVNLLIDQNLVEGQARASTGMWMIHRLTNAGHDFLANARTSTAWEQAKAKAGNASFEIFTSVLAKLAENMVG